MSDYAHTVLWVVGEPGIGKTTFCRKLLASHGTRARVLEENGTKWTFFGEHCAAVGTWEGSKFDGGDTVPPSKILPALGVYRDHLLGSKLVLFDGDKFANANAVRFVYSVISLKSALFAESSRLVCVHLVGPASAASGRAQRVAAGAKPQNESWVRGRATKSARFADAFGPFGDIITINRDEGQSWDIEL